MKHTTERKKGAFASHERVCVCVCVCVCARVRACALCACVRARARVFGDIPLDVAELEKPWETPKGFLFAF